MTQLQVKSSVRSGCVFLGKGIKGRPEMGVVVECRRVTFDEWDLMRQEWTGRHEETRMLYMTDNGYVFDDSQLYDERLFQIEEHAPNWRAKKKDAWGLF